MNPSDPSHARTPEERLLQASQGLPPPIPPAHNSAPDPEPADHPPVTGFFATAEALLRQPDRIVRQCGGGPTSLPATLTLIALGGALVYGLVVGTFSGHDQLWAAPAKVAAGLLVSALICLPSLYIFSSLSGSRARLGQVGGLLAGLVALLTLLLLGFAPVAWVFSQSTENVAAMGALHLAFFAIATGFGLRFLKHGFQSLGSDANGGLRVWTVIYVLVMLQMTTALRPFVGTAPTLLPTEKKFFLSHWGDHLNNPSRATDSRR